MTEETELAVELEGEEIDEEEAPCVLCGEYDCDCDWSKP